MRNRAELAVLPEIPHKRYFAIGEVSELCAVKPHVLRYWEQEFPQLRPVKRRGNRRYYQQDDVLMVRRIRSLLYEQGFTITGARQRLRELDQEPEAANDAVRLPSGDTPLPIPRRRRELQSIRFELEELLARWPH
ncbi:MAG: MerR family transcriptional regulator [Gammaproteobacteria bacterium]|nr:MerR family transcriptional regulator [Gammaproteobacteria bacterium]